jgi:hypothetical protein
LLEDRPPTSRLEAMAPIIFRLACSGASTALHNK